MEVARANANATNVEQRFYGVTDDDKRNVVRQILTAAPVGRAAISANTAPSARSPRCWAAHEGLTRAPRRSCLEIGLSRSLRRAFFISRLP